MVLFMMLITRTVSIFESVDEILKYDTQMKAIEQFFPVVLFTMLYRVILTIGSVIFCKILRRTSYFGLTFEGDKCFKKLVTVTTRIQFPTRCHFRSS